MQEHGEKIQEASGGCECGRYKHTPRAPQQLKALRNRINRIIGQLGGVGHMLEQNRYCGDILTQLAAAQSALQSLGYCILQEHMQTCVAEEIKSGNEEIVKETMELVRKLK